MSGRERHVVVVGAGIGGLTAALLLAVRGVRVTVVERAAAPGGKMRAVEVGGRILDAGPTVFTMRWVFDEIFAAAGETLDAHLTLRPAITLARHAWSEAERLDLFADIDRTADAIGDFAGPAEARGYHAFCAHARDIYRTLRASFILAPAPTPLSLVRSAGFRGLGDLRRIRPFETMWRALGQHFKDPRLRQLFGRYATYCGSSPFLAPATLMLVAHVEQDGVWLVEGGLHCVAAELARAAERRGAAFRYRSHVAAVLTDTGRASGVCLASGERIAADAVIANTDVAALAAGLLGSAVAGAVPSPSPAGRSLSALTWAMVTRTEGFPLLRHTVFFSTDYAAEFDALFGRGQLPTSPTVYVCAQDRDDTDRAPAGEERLFILINAPAIGDRKSLTGTEIARCTERTFGTLARCGLTVRHNPDQTLVTTPSDFDGMFPATGGALYGQAVHGAMATFRRPGARSRIPGLYLAGGSTHPGAGVPMAALSGRMAADSVLMDLASTPACRVAVTRGGISTG